LAPRVIDKSDGVVLQTRALAVHARPLVALATEGHTNAETAAGLYLSLYTVETHLKHVFAKLGLRSRTQLATSAATVPTTSRDT
jgi:DNA-binding CsgD family transcriptional regulator